MEKSLIIWNKSCYNDNITNNNITYNLMMMMMKKKLFQG